QFVTQLKDRGVFIAFTLTHVSELFGHGNQDVLRERLKFLHTIELIAWLRPYRRQRFPGGIPELFTRELDAVVHHSARGWEEIIRKVREALWETGMGSDIFKDNDRFLSSLHAQAKDQHKHDMYIASVARL